MLKSFGVSGKKIGNEARGVGLVMRRQFGKYSINGARHDKSGMKMRDNVVIIERRGVAKVKLGLGLFVDATLAP